MTTVPLLVTAEWLADNLDNPDIKIIDASFHLPTAGRDVQAEFVEAHIPGAVLFDIEAIKDTSSDLPHMMPDPAEFARMVGELGISNDHHVIAYDSVGIFSAPRAWWMFRAMGHDKVSILDGGLAKWVLDGHPTKAGAATPTPDYFEASLQADMIVDMGAVEAAIGKTQIADARAAARFTGEAAEPRHGLRSGHIPGSRNLPSSTLIDPETGQFKDTATMRAAFEQAGLDIDKPMITSCGSGVTAAILSFALALMGKTDTRLYDGSWSEWGMEGGPAIETGPAS